MITPWTDLTELVRAAKARLRDPGPVLLGPVTRGVRESFANQFETTGSYGSSPWAPLSASTVSRRGSGQPLGRGTLWASLTESNSTYGYAVLRDRWTLAVGTTDPVAVFHQLGTRRMPQRRIVPPVIPDRDRDRWASLAATYILEGRL